MTLGQETRWAYSTTLPSTHGATSAHEQVYHLGDESRPVLVLLLISIQIGYKASILILIPILVRVSLLYLFYPILIRALLTLEQTSSIEVQQQDLVMISGQHSRRRNSHKHPVVIEGAV